MSRSSDKRITLRFYLDDPDACELYERLQLLRRETGRPMSTLTMEALKARYATCPHADDDPNEGLREMLRTEIRAALREWSLATPMREAGTVASESEPTDFEDEEYDSDSIQAALAFSL